MLVMHAHRRAVACATLLLAASSCGRHPVVPRTVVSLDAPSSVRVESTIAAPRAGGCRFVGRSERPQDVFLRQDSPRPFARVSGAAMLDVELGTDPSLRPSIRVERSGVRFGGTLGQLELYAQTSLSYRGVFHTVWNMPLRVAAERASTISLRVQPRSWEGAPVSFREPAYWTEPCDAFSLTPLEPKVPTGGLPPEAATRSLASHTTSGRTTVSATPDGQPVLDVVRSMVVQTVPNGSWMRVWWDTGDGRFSGYVRRGTLSEPPGSLGFGIGTVGHPIAPRNVHCEKAVDLWVVDAQQSEATLVGELAPHAHARWLKDLPVIVRGKRFVAIDLDYGIESSSGYLFAIEQGPAVDCRTEIAHPPSARR